MARGNRSNKVRNKDGEISYNLMEKQAKLNNIEQKEQEEAENKRKENELILKKKRQDFREKMARQILEKEELSRKIVVKKASSWNVDKSTILSQSKSSSVWEHKTIPKKSPWTSSNSVNKKSSVWNVDKSTISFQSKSSSVCEHETLPKKSSWTSSSIANEKSSMWKVDKSIVLKKSPTWDVDNSIASKNYGWSCTKKQNIPVEKNETENSRPYLVVELTDSDVKVDPKCQYTGFRIGKNRDIIYLYNSIMKRGKEGNYDMSILVNYMFSLTNMELLMISGYNEDGNIFQKHEIVQEKLLVATTSLPPIAFRPQLIKNQKRRFILMQKAIAIVKKNLHNVCLEDLHDLDIDDIPEHVLESMEWGEGNDPYSDAGRWKNLLDKHQRKDVEEECYNLLTERDERLLGLISFNTIFDLGFRHFPKHSSSAKKCWCPFSNNMNLFMKIANSFAKSDATCVTAPCNGKNSKNCHPSTLLEHLQENSGCFAHQVIYIYLKLTYGYIHDRNLGHSAFYRSKKLKKSKQAALKIEENFRLVQAKFQDDEDQTKFKDHKFWINNYRENGIIKKHVPKGIKHSHDVKRMDTSMKKKISKSDDKQKKLDSFMVKKNINIKKGKGMDSSMIYPKKKMDASMQNKVEQVKVNMDKSIVVPKTSFAIEEKSNNTSIHRNINKRNMDSSISRIPVDVSQRSSVVEETRIEVPNHINDNSSNMDSSISRNHVSVNPAPLLHPTVYPPSTLSITFRRQFFKRHVNKNFLPWQMIHSNRRKNGFNVPPDIHWSELKNHSPYWVHLLTQDVKGHIKKHLALPESNSRKEFVSLIYADILHYIQHRQVLNHDNVVHLLNQYNEGWGIGRGDCLQNYIPDYFWKCLVHNIAKVSFLCVHNIPVLKNQYKIDDCRRQSWFQDRIPFNFNYERLAIPDEFRQYVIPEQDDFREWFANKTMFSKCFRKTYCTEETRSTSYVNKIHKNIVKKYDFSDTVKYKHTRTCNEEKKIHGKCQQKVEANVNEIHSINCHVNKYNDTTENGFSYSCKNVNKIHKPEPNIKYVRIYYGTFIDAHIYFIRDDAVSGNHEMTRVTCTYSSVNSNVIGTQNTMMPLNVLKQHCELNEQQMKSSFALTSEFKSHFRVEPYIKCISFDGCSIYISVCQMDLLNGLYPYTKKLNFKTLYETIEQLTLHCDKMKTDTRSVTMYLMGSTMGRTQSPMFLPKHTSKQKILPRPFVKSRPPSKLLEITKEFWFTYLIRLMEEVTLQHINKVIETYKEEHYIKIKRSLTFAKKYIPKCLRVCNTFFTQVGILRNEDKVNEHRINLHKDKGDIISCILTLGRVEGIESGKGSTVYYNGKSKDNPGEKIYEVPFVNGQIQVTTFCNVVHGSNPFQQHRYTLNANIKRNILIHFFVYGDQYYRQYMKSNYTREKFVAV